MAVQPSTPTAVFIRYAHQTMQTGDFLVQKAEQYSQQTNLFSLLSLAGPSPLTLIEEAKEAYVSHKERFKFIESKLNDEKNITAEIDPLIQKANQTYENFLGTFLNQLKGLAEQARGELEFATQATLLYQGLGKDKQEQISSLDKDLKKLSVLLGQPSELQIEDKSTIRNHFFTVEKDLLQQLKNQNSVTHEWEKYSFEITRNRTNAWHNKGFKSSYVEEDKVIIKASIKDPNSNSPSTSFLIGEGSSRSSLDSAWRKCIESISNK